MPTKLSSKRRNEKGRALTALFWRDPERALAMLLTISVFCYGLYEYWCALLAGAFLALLLYRTVKKGKTIAFPLSLPSAAIYIAVLFYLISMCWATDKGMAFFGFLKYLPIPLFIVLSATAGVDRERLLRSLARAGGFSVAICLPLCVIPEIRDFFFTNGRFSGTFQYANIYGLFLLASVVILCEKKISLKSDYALCALCTLGVFLTGSRSLLVFAAVVFVVLIFVNWRVALVSASGVLVAALLAIILTTGETLQRAVNLSFTAGEWLNRLAYYQDGFRLILENPFGLGHLGWWYMQPVIQTSVYNVRLIHCWPLQAALDIGAIPALLLITAAIALFFNKRNGYKAKLLIALILGHGLIDFDLSYLSVVFILVLFLPNDRLVKASVTGRRMAIPLALCSIAAIASLWLGIASFLSFSNRDKAAAMLYPLYTEAMERAIVTEPDPEQAFYWADRILNLNPYVFDAYVVKSKVYADKKMWLDAVTMKWEYLSISRFRGSDYDELLKYIHFAIQQADQEGDADTCRHLADLALSVPATLAGLDESLSPLAYRLELPTLSLSEDSTRFLAYIQEFRATLG